ncbi:MAG: DUF1579 family protein [Blastocatellia bacterium]|nr:DUF1579 family protein [Blastocatellia bacterium]
MSVTEKFAALAGEWTGTNRLNMSWLPDPVKESSSTAVVQQRLNGQCLEIAYTWEFDGEHHQGFLILNGDPKSDAATAVWSDSWHSANVLMYCSGRLENEGRVVLIGHYKVADHPDWGWRTEIETTAEGFTYRMFNISPEGDEEWAVETDFTRAGAD